MLSMDIFFTQILIILLYVLVGFAAGKAGLIDPGQRKYLTRICTDLVIPFTILSASSQAVTGKDMADMAMAAAMMFALFTLATFFSLRVQTARNTPTPVKVTTTALVTYPNCTFLGLPLARALFGDVAILYNAACVIAFNVLYFTCQSSLFTGERFRFRNLVKPSTVSTAVLIAMLALGLRFPDPVQTVVNNIGAMITPLSLIIIGVMTSENSIATVLKERRAYWITLLRNLAAPLVTMLVLRLMPFEPSVRLCFLVFMACPCAALTSIYAIQNDMEPELAAHSVLMSTLFFAVTLPAILFLGTRVLG